MPNWLLFIMLRFRVIDKGNGLT